MAQRVIALEISGDRARAAVAERTWNSFKLAGVLEQQRATDEPDLSAALARLVAQAGKPDILISALPGELIAKRLLELPFGDSRRLHQVVPFALEEHLPFPVDGAMVTYSRVGTEGDKTLVIAAFARKLEVQQHLELLAKAGLDPKVVTLAPFALAAMIGRARNGTGPRAHLVLDGGQAATSMVLLGPNGRPHAMRTVRGGLVMPDGNPPPPAESNLILNAVRQTLLAHGQELEHPDLILTGPAAASAKVRTLLHDSLAIAVRDAAELDYSSIFEGVSLDTAKYAACVAMLLSELPGRPIELLNFRQGELTFRGRVRGDLTPFYTSGMLAAAVAVFAILHFILGVSTSLHRLHALDSEIAAVAAPALGTAASANAKAQLQTRIAKMSQQLRVLGGSISRTSALDALLSVSSALPPHLPLAMEDVQIDSSGLKLSGQADSFATVDQAKKALSQAGYFQSIEVTEAKAGSDSSKVDFRIDASFRDAPGKGE
jgi:type II secretory pathway component PulL